MAKAAEKIEPLKPEVVAAAPAPPPAPVVAVEAPKPIGLPLLTMDTFQLKESRNPGWWHCAPIGTSIEQILTPGYWANFAGKMQRQGRQCTIEVHWADASQFAELYVVEAGRNWARVALMRHIKIECVAPPPDTNKFAVGWGGPVDQFRVTNLLNNTVLKAGFPSEVDAQRFLAEHLKKLG